MSIFDNKGKGGFPAKEYKSFINIMNGQIESPQSEETDMQVKASILMLESLSEQGLDIAGVDVSRVYLLKGRSWYNPKRAEYVLKQKAEKGNSDACCALGKLYMEGSGEVAQDPVSGKFWIEKAASMGNRDAVKEKEKRGW